MENDEPDVLTIHENLILVRESARSKSAIIKKLGGLLFKEGFVKDSFVKAVLEREKVYPTGLQARVTGVAVPHTDTDHVIKSAVAIATLNKPVIFQGMAAPETEIPIFVVIMLAIHNPKHVVDILRKVILVIEDDDSLKKILAAEKTSEIKQIVEDHILAVS